MPEFLNPIKGGAFELQDGNPFDVGASEGINLGRFDTEWVVGKYKAEFDEVMLFIDIYIDLM